MKFFIDTANIDEIRKACELGLIDGVTTNPSLISKEGRDPNALFREICAIVDGPVNAEVVGLTAEDMIREAEGLSKIHANIVVKIPMSETGLEAISRCKAEGIKTNPAKRSEVADELADVLCYVMALANRLEIDLSAAVQAKMLKNAKKYPVEQFRGYFGPEDPRWPGCESPEH